MCGMSAFRPSRRLSDFAVWLLFLAAYAHLSLSTVSGIHHARMMALDPAQWAAICTQAGISQVRLATDDGSQPGEPQTLTECPICAVASLPPTPTVPDIQTAFRQDVLLYRLPAPAAVAAASTSFATLPPARAPPVVS